VRMKVELNTDELNTILVALQNITIKGADAPALADILNKVSKAFDKAVTKDAKDT
jgi:hypothetical protein